MCFSWGTAVTYPRQIVVRNEQRRPRCVAPPALRLIRTRHRRTERERPLALLEPLASSRVRCLRQRGVAQPGSALALGARGRRFESGRPDCSIYCCWSRRSRPERRSWLGPCPLRPVLPPRQLCGRCRNGGRTSRAGPPLDRGAWVSGLTPMSFRSQGGRGVMLVAFVLKSRRPARRRSARRRAQTPRRQPPASATAIETPAICWSLIGDQPPEPWSVGVEVVDRLGHERHDEPDRARQQERGKEVGGFQPRRESAVHDRPPEQHAGDEVERMLEMEQGVRVPQRRVVDPRQMPEAVVDHPQQQARAAAPPAGHALQAPAGSRVRRAPAPTRRGRRSGSGAPRAVGSSRSSRSA